MNDNITIEELNEELKKYELKNIYVDLFSIGRFNVEKSLIKVTYKNFYKYEYVPNTRSPEARESLKIFLYGENNEEAEDEDDFHTIAYSLGIVYVDASNILGYDDKDKDLPVLAQYNVFKPMLLDDENIKSEEKIVYENKTRKFHIQQREGGNHWRTIFGIFEIDGKEIDLTRNNYRSSGFFDKNGNQILED